MIFVLLLIGGFFIGVILMVAIEMATDRQVINLLEDGEPEGEDDEQA